VLAGPRGLAAQLNRGVAAARGEILVFLHADTRLPRGGLAALEAALGDPAVAGGAFKLGFDSARLRFRAVAFFGNLRNRLGFGPFGDQALFARRSAFVEVGGFRAGKFLEDLDLVRRLRRRGRFRVLPQAVRTSARRWERHGFAGTLLLHWRLSAAYLLGRRER
jgi:GT2 family glycosyltransferase